MAAARARSAPPVAQASHSFSTDAWISTHALDVSLDQTKLSRLSSCGTPMRTVNIHEAKTQLSKLVDAAAKGEAFIIAKAGKPLVKVVPVDAPAAPRRLGFMRGEFTVPTTSTRCTRRKSKSCLAPIDEAIARHPYPDLGRERTGRLLQDSCHRY